jgi:hypothetical protein
MFEDSISECSGSVIGQSAELSYEERIAVAAVWYRARCSRSTMDAVLCLRQKSWAIWIFDQGLGYDRRIWFVQ